MTSGVSLELATGSAPQIDASATRAGREVSEVIRRADRPVADSSAFRARANPC
jgi:hypothetical protein